MAETTALLPQTEIEHEPPPWHVCVDQLASAVLSGRNVYFIGCGSGPIKIGVAGSVKARLNTIQTSSPVLLKVLASRHGDETVETAYHAWFAEHRLHGEWFHPAPAILFEIERLKGNV